MNTTLLTTQLSIILPALLAGVLVLISHIPLGLRVLQRGIIFIDLAIAQIAALGLLTVTLVQPEANLLLQQLGAFLAAFTAALFFSYSEQRWPAQQEAIIGCSYVLAACCAHLLLANHPHGNEALQTLLLGQILWVSPSQLIPLLLLTPVLLIVLWRSTHPLAFYLSFACAITLSVQLVGVWLVFASLIIPALASRQRKHVLRTASAIGVLGYLIGLSFANYTDLPAGALIVISMATLALCSQSWQWHNKLSRTSNF